MSQKHLESSRNTIESCTLQLLSWRPFHRSKTLETSEQPQSQSPYGSSVSSTKRPCFSDRSTTSFSIEAMSRLSLADEDKHLSASNHSTKGSFRLVARKRRRRNSRSVSGRSSDRSGTLRCCSIGAHGTCSDFPFAVGTDSSGELFSEANWASDVSEARRSRRDSGGEKEAASGFGFAVGVVDPMGNESGYGSEPGYRGDVEFGYGDEYDDEEEDVKPLFWGDRDSTMEMSGNTKFSDSKPQFRCRRRRQHDYKTVDSMR
ncbi:LYR motif protein [Hirschfeldia incana]|nr:LYR motif protein [Hirschfeldia incana]